VSRLLPTIRLILMLAVALLAAAPAWPHNAPLATMTTVLDEVEFVQELTLRGDLFQDWTGVDPEILDPRKEMADEERARIHAGLVTDYQTWMRVTIDGVEVTPVVRVAKSFSMVHDGAVFPYMALTVAYGCKGRAKHVGMVWRRFDNTLGWSVAPIDTEIDAFGITDYVIFSEREPEFTWHAPVIPEGAREAIDKAPLLVMASMTLPLVSTVIVVLLVLALPVLLLKRVRRRVVACVAAAGVVLAGALFAVAPIEIELPWEAGYAMPDEAQAAYVFEQLHRNIYRAFDYESEDDIYDTLARTVEGDLLDEVYAEVYESLILRDEGGVVCKVGSTQILESDVEIPEDPELRQFQVECRWRVKGTVSHLNHRHVRMNEYHARYVVTWRNGGWKISGVEILTQERVNPNEPG
jgi:hypothetical protein